MVGVGGWGGGSRRIKHIGHQIILLDSLYRYLVNLIEPQLFTSLVCNFTSTIVHGLHTHVFVMRERLFCRACLIILRWNELFRYSYKLHRTVPNSEDNLKFCASLMLVFLSTSSAACLTAQYLLSGCEYSRLQ